MLPYDKMILNKLLDSYEQSLLSVGENVRTVNIEMRFTRKTIPAYFDESEAEYEQIHIWAKRLEEKKLIVIVWKNQKADHIIEKVRLNMEHISEAYKYAGRTPKRQHEDNMLQMLGQYLCTVETPECHAVLQENANGERKMDGVSVCAHFIAFLMQRIKAHKPVKEYINLEDLDGTRKLLDIVKCIEQNDRSLYIREFSVKVLNDSKAFEKMENKVAGIFRKFSDRFHEAELPEILAEYNIYHTPNYVYLKGDGMIEIGDEKINLSALRQGVGISGDDIDRVRIISPQEQSGTVRDSNADFQEIKKVITIENLTTFFRYAEPNSLIVYLGGYHNTNRRIMLQKIHKSLPNALYYHFGDIDAGGFQIFHDLKKKTGIPFSMLHMDLETLRRYEVHGKPLTKEDKKRLQELALDEKISDVVKYMLEHNVKLEQECVFFGGVR